MFREKPIRKSDKSKSLLNKAINEYLNNIPREESKLLKEELTYNLEFKEDFSTRINQFACMFAALHCDNDDEFNSFSSQFISREKTKNPYIINMYKHYIDNMVEIFGIMYDIDNIVEEIDYTYAKQQIEEAVKKMKNIIEKSNFYHDLNDQINNDKKDKKSKL